MVIAASVAQMEAQLQILYQLLVYALPLIGAILTAYIGLYYQLRKVVRRNSRNLQEVARIANGKLDSLNEKVDNIHVNTLDHGGRRGRGAGLGTGRTPDPGGTAVPPPVAPVHPVDAQPPDGD